MLIINYFFIILITLDKTVSDPDLLTTNMNRRLYTRMLPLRQHPKIKSK